MSRRVIEIFVENTETIVGALQTYEFVSPGHECTRRPITVPIREPVLPETHRQLVKTAENVAKEKGMKLKVYNLSSKMDRVRAFLKGVKETPTIIIGNHKLFGEITEKTLLSLLE